MDPDQSLTGLGLRCYHSFELHLGVVPMRTLFEAFPADYTYQLMVQLNMFCQLIFSGLIVGSSLRRKRYWFLWLLLSLALCAAALQACVILRIYYNNLATRFIMRLIQFAMPLCIILLGTSNVFTIKLKTWCAGVAAMEIGAACYSLLLAILGVDERVTICLYDGSKSPDLFDWILYYAIHLLVYLIVFRLARPRRDEEMDRTGHLSTTLLTQSCLLFLTVPDCVSNEFRAESWSMLLVNRIYLLALSTFILALCSGIELQSYYRTRMTVMEQVVANERKQYQQMKENIDVINMRCHDLKHQLDDFSGKLTAAELDSLREAMDIYDRNIRTGSEVLDVVLYLSQLTCQNEGIELTCLADGGALSFMRTSHIYSLFNNAIGNALEAVRKLDNKEKRVVSVTVAACDEQVIIEVTNFFDGVLAGTEVLKTTKKDKGHHGFGTMSMRYVAQQYGGTMSIQTQRDVFNLRISIPIPCHL